MKIKGTNAFEQHVEKLLLLVVTVALLGVLAMQFMTQPNAVDVGGGDSVAPKDIFQNLATKARGIDGQLVDVNPAFPEVSSVDLQAAYEAQLVEPITPADRLAIAFGVPSQAGGVLGDLAGSAELIGPSGPIVGLKMPELGGVYATSNWNTVDPYAVAQSSVLARYVTNRQPHDLATVSVQTILDGTMLREALTTAPEGSRQIPRKFWSQTGMAVMSVEVQRERLDADGAWAADGRAVPMPGTIQPSWYVKGDETLADYTEMISNATTVADRVMRPEFPATISGPTWLPPIQAAKREASYANIGDINRLEARIASLGQEIERLKNPGAGRQTTTPNRAPGGRRPGGPATTTSDPSQNTTVRDRSIEAKQEQIVRLQNQIEELRFTGEEDAGDPGRGSDPSAFVPRGGQPGAGFSSPSRGGSLLDSDRVPVWTHDLAVEPGATYRYRIRVGVNNPLFGRGAQLEENNAEHQQLATEPISYTPWTGWSEPVLVGAREYFFVTNASPSGAMVGSGSPRATGELYTMHYGYYRKDGVQLAPGDPVRGDAKAPEGLVSIDTTKMDRAAAIAALAAYQQSLGREDVISTGGYPDPGRNSDPRTGFPVGNPRDPGLADPTTTPLKFELPDGMAAMAGRLSMGLQVTLLDVSDRPLAAESRVYLREPDGSVRVVTPGEESMAYSLVSQSDALAEGSWLNFSGTEQGGGGAATEPNPFGPVPDGIWDGP
ncbi:MAG: hypothetical protein ACI89L_002538 [Phycisphaerales bacterium]|jgi:hypothetical protein